MAGAGETLDVSEFAGGSQLEDSDYTQLIEDSTETPNWGYLFPLHDSYTKVDLIEDLYSFGRDDTCSICYLPNSAGDNHIPHFQALSKTHFIIKRENHSSSEDTNLEIKQKPSNFIIYLTDKSSNGTFLDGEKIGKGKTKILKHNSIISLSLKKNKSYVFFDKTFNIRNEFPELPQEFTQKFALTNILGKGACGEVRHAFDISTAENFAVKIIEIKRFQKDDKALKSALAELKILKELDHPCIIRIFDAYQISTHFFIILEFMGGGELFDRIVKLGKFSDSQSKFTFNQILLAVKYLHNQDITHRDLKPENILLVGSEEDTIVKITDFGLSKVVGEGSLMKTLCGTPSYLAPEVILSAEVSGYTPKCDCWSLGVILFIMLSGYPPFSNEIQEHSLTEQITKGIFSFPEKFWSDVDPNAIDLIKSLLKVDPDERISVNDAIAHPWLNDSNLKNKMTQVFGADSKIDSFIFKKPNTARIVNSQNKNSLIEQSATMNIDRKRLVCDDDDDEMSSPCSKRPHMSTNLSVMDTS